MNTYDIGDLVRVTGAFSNAAGAAVDPSTLRFKFKTPKGVITTYTYGTDTQLARTAAGNYLVDVSAAEEGVYHYRWEGSGAVGQSAGEGSFEVTQSEF